MPISIDIVRQDFKQLKLGVMTANLQTVITDAASKNQDSLTVIKLLVEMEREKNAGKTVSADASPRQGCPKR